MKYLISKKDIPYWGDECRKCIHSISRCIEEVKHEPPPKLNWFTKLFVDTQEQVDATLEDLNHDLSFIKRIVYNLNNADNVTMIQLEPQEVATLNYWRIYNFE